MDKVNFSKLGNMINRQKRIEKFIEPMGLRLCGVTDDYKKWCVCKPCKNLIGQPSISLVGYIGFECGPMEIEYI